jgi:hypothetical protein
METKEFLRINPQLRKWTFSQLMSGGMRLAMHKMYYSPSGGGAGGLWTTGPNPTSD